MRRHSSLAVTSAIVMVGGVGVFGGGALGPRASAISNHPKSVRTTPLRRRAMTQVRRTSETASLLRDDPVARTLPYLIVDHPRRPGRSVVRRPHLLARPAATAAQWRALRTCESGDSYGMDTGNGYYGAYQFALGDMVGPRLPGVAERGSGGGSGPRRPPPAAHLRLVGMAGLLDTGRLVGRA